MKDLEIAFISFSALSIACSGSVLLSVVIFPEMKKRLFMKLILYISLCNVIASFASSFGFPRDGSFLCSTQSFFVVYFFMASWLWTTMLAHQLYSISTNSSFGLSRLHMHLICWSIPLISTLLPLSTNRYGRDDDDGDPTGWCYLAGVDLDSSAMWFIFFFVLPLFICVLIMIYFSIRIYIIYRSLGELSNRPDLKATIHALLLYPLGMVVTWGPNLFLLILIAAGKIRQSNALTDTIDASKEARYRWWLLLSSLLLMSGETDADEISCSALTSSHAYDPSTDYVPVDFEEGKLFDADNRKTRTFLATLPEEGSPSNSMNMILNAMFGEGERMAELPGGPEDSALLSDPLLLSFRGRLDSDGSKASAQGWDRYPSATGTDPADGPI